MLTGNIARCGCVVKTAGVDENCCSSRGPARVYESQEQAMEGILGDEVRPGEVVVIRYEGPKGGPGMQGRCSTPPPTSNRNGSTRYARS